MTDEERSLLRHLEVIKDVLKRDPAVKSFIGACDALGAPEVRTAAEAIAILKEKPDSIVILKFSGISAEQKQAMQKELDEYFAERRRTSIGTNRT
jgi:hypothetical protein